MKRSKFTTEYTENTEEVYLQLSFLKSASYDSVYSVPSVVKKRFIR